MLNDRTSMSSVPSAQVCSCCFEMPGRWFRTNQFALLTHTGRDGCAPRRGLATAARFSLCMLLWFHLAAAKLGAVTFTVTSLTDNGTGSLRETIQNASSGDIIQLGVSGTITLTNGELLIARDLIITAPSAKTLAISGNNATRVFNISNATVTISGLTIRDGFAGGAPAIGAGILNRGMLVLSDCRVFA